MIEAILRVLLRVFRHLSIPSDLGHDAGRRHMIAGRIPPDNGNDREGQMQPPHRIHDAKGCGRVLCRPFHSKAGSVQDVHFVDLPGAGPTDPHIKRMFHDLGVNFFPAGSAQFLAVVHPWENRFRRQDHTGRDHIAHQGAAAHLVHSGQRCTEAQMGLIIGQHFPEMLHPFFRRFRGHGTFPPSAQFPR